MDQQWGFDSTDVRVEVRNDENRADQLISRAVLAKPDAIRQPPCRPLVKRSIWLLKYNEAFTAEKGIVDVDLVAMIAYYVHRHHKRQRESLTPAES